MTSSLLHFGPPGICFVLVTPLVLRSPPSGFVKGV